MSKISKNSKFIAAKMFKMAVFVLLKSDKLISRKVCLTEKIMKFPHCDAQSGKILREINF